MKGGVSRIRVLSGAKTDEERAPFGALFINWVEHIIDGKEVHDLRWQVGAIIVVFHPDMDRLHCLVQRLAGLVVEIVLINNGTTPLHVTGWPNNILIRHARRNLGVAAALNLGVRLLARRHCTHAWSFDQDSLPAVDALEKLQSAWIAAPQASFVAAVAPRTQEYETARILPFLLSDEQGTVQGKVLHNPQEISAAITSGLLFRVDVWRALGGALEPLFIDHVDTEWCWRLRNAGWRILAVPDARMDHQLGEVGPRLAWFFGPRVTVRAPIRSYYMLRNGWLLGRMTSAPLGWRRYQRWQAAKIIIVALLHGPQRWSQLWAILRAVRDACRDHAWVR